MLPGWLSGERQERSLRRNFSSGSMNCDACTAPGKAPTVLKMIRPPMQPHRNPVCQMMLRKKTKRKVVVFTPALKVLLQVLMIHQMASDEIFSVKDSALTLVVNRLKRHLKTAALLMHRTTKFVLGVALFPIEMAIMGLKGEAISMERPSVNPAETLAFNRFEPPRK